LAWATPLEAPEELLLAPVLVPELVAVLAGVVPDALAEEPPEAPPDEDEPLLLLPHAAIATAQTTTRTSEARRLFRLNGFLSLRDALPRSSPCPPVCIGHVIDPPLRYHDRMQYANRIVCNMRSEVMHERGLRP
jgi:hypothetical protein